ncbi:hypothetical protein A4X03_0g3474 [Tilletia caries]|uniref:Extracellular membrane protein CFEM domain-containing protein n=1 Tax=Tilletia caries TaxID=13290 RepID=A0A8T8TKF8_9BASI|nr:hypothetical protein A4X03_0g3474 [Tilletia caries]
MKFNILLVLGTLSAFGTVSCQGETANWWCLKVRAACKEPSQKRGAYENCVCTYWRSYPGSNNVRSQAMKVNISFIGTPDATAVPLLQKWTHATSGQPPPARLNSSTKSSSTQPPKSPPSIATPYHPLSSPPRGVRVAVRVKKQRGKDSEEGAGKGEVVEIDH